MMIRRCTAAVVCLHSVISASAQGKAQDPVTSFFTSVGFSNIPYVSQTDAAVGTVVYWDGAAADGPIFMDQADVSNVQTTRGGTVIPSGSVQKVADAGLELNLFGFKPSVEFQNFKTLTYSEIVLDTTAAKYSQIVPLVALNSPVDQQVHPHFKVGQQPNLFGIKYGTGVYSDGFYYLVGKVFTTTGSGDITQTDGTQIAATSGGDIPKCDYAEPTAGAGKDKTSTTTPTTDNKPAPTSTTTEHTPAPATAPNTHSTATDASPATVETTITSGIDRAATVATTAIGGTTKKVADTASAPSGGVHYCRKDSKTVHFDAAHPFPVAMYLYLMNLNPSDGYKTFILKPQVVAFVNPEVQKVR